MLARACALVGALVAGGYARVRRQLARRRRRAGLAAGVAIGRRGARRCGDRHHGGAPRARVSRPFRRRRPLTCCHGFPHHAEPPRLVVGSAAPGSPSLSPSSRSRRSPSSAPSSAARGPWSPSLPSLGVVLGRRRHPHHPLRADGHPPRGRAGPGRAGPGLPRPDRRPHRRARRVRRDDAGSRSRRSETAIDELEVALTSAQKRAAEATRKLNAEARRADVAEHEGRTTAGPPRRRRGARRRGHRPGRRAGAGARRAARRARRLARHPGPPPRLTRDNATAGLIRQRIRSPAVAASVRTRPAERPWRCGGRARVGHNQGP